VRTMMLPRSSMRAPVGRALAATLLAGAALAACGEDGSETSVSLPAAAEAGRSIYRSSGCSACHGPDGEGGGLGPELQGLYGTEVSVILQGEDTVTTVVADEAYIRQAITDPDAARPEAFADRVMPLNPALSDDDIASLVRYIEAIGPAPTGDADE